MEKRKYFYQEFNSIDFNNDIIKLIESMQCISYKEFGNTGKLDLFTISIKRFINNSELCSFTCDYFLNEI